MSGRSNTSATLCPTGDQRKNSTCTEASRTMLATGGYLLSRSDRMRATTSGVLASPAGPRDRIRSVNSSTVGVSAARRRISIAYSDND